ncbi:hypothetical protein ABNU44_14060 [Serratia marcescens]|uniref:hypothetical protein n=1 Tax=Serratia marcescens TaxID=615 RepID=UPI00339BA2C6
MSTWILIVIAMGGYNGTSPAVGFQEFNSQGACVMAANEVGRLAEIKYYFKTACVQKG